MAIGRGELLDDLGSFLADLKPTHQARAADLTEAYLAVSRVLIGPYGSIVTTARRSAASGALARRPGVAVATNLGQAVDQVLGQKVGATAPLVCRRSLPVRTEQHPASIPTWAAGRATSRSYGPFTDEIGRPFWIDVFPIATGVPLLRGAGASPFLVVPGTIGTGPVTTLSLGSGSLWIASQQLVSTAPAGGYTGLRIKSGTLTFSSAVAQTAKGIIVPPAITATLILRLDPPTPTAGTGPGGPMRGLLARHSRPH
jgi:hypothetical protein